MKRLRKQLNELSPSEFIQKRLETIDISQAEVARQMEKKGVTVSKPLISMWLNGRRLPRGKKLDVLCQVLAIYGDVRTELLARIAVMQGMIDGE